MINSYVYPNTLYIINADTTQCKNINKNGQTLQKYRLTMKFITQTLITTCTIEEINFK